MKADALTPGLLYHAAQGTAVRFIELRRIKSPFGNRTQLRAIMEHPNTNRMDVALSQVLPIADQAAAERTFQERASHFAEARSEMDRVMALDATTFAEEYEVARTAAELAEQEHHAAIARHREAQRALRRYQARANDERRAAEKAASNAT